MNTTPLLQKNGKHVKQYILANGMTVLIHEDHAVPKVTSLVMYNVGSADEKEGEKGLAHFLEHAIFKGTGGKHKKSEGDIDTITKKLSGSCNAFTGHDYTGYYFDFPSQQWEPALEMLADGMVHATLADDHLNSEMKAVIQELKMNRDDYHRFLVEELFHIIFMGHPYHYPIIGYKTDLGVMYSDNLAQFYKKYYRPDNATLVISGDVKTEQALELAQQYFGHLQNPTTIEQRPPRYFTPDIGAKSLTLYRDIQQPLVVLAFVIPGLHAKQDHLATIVSSILGSNKSSRLHIKLVDELQLVTALSSGNYDCMDHGVFIIAYEPKDIKDCAQIENIITEEIQHIVTNGVSAHDIGSTINQVKMHFYTEQESNLKKAISIGRYFFATKDAEYSYSYLNEPIEQLQHETQAFIAQYLRPTVMHRGMLLPLPEQEKATWLAQQEASDAWDQEFLNSRERKTPIESPIRAHEIEPKKPKAFNFPKPETIKLNNGLKVLYYRSARTPKINLGLSLAAKPYYDSTEKPGLYAYTCAMLDEGTKQYTAAEFADQIDAHGMSLSCSPGAVSMSMLASDFTKGLTLLTDILTNAAFRPTDVEKIRAQMLAHLNNFWDEPTSFASQLVREHLYKHHPFAKRTLGTPEGIESITRTDLVDFYHQVITPEGAVLALVGDLPTQELQTILEQTLGTWHGKALATPELPALEEIEPCVIDYPINRDQVVLCFAGLSIGRLNPDYDKLLLFDQIFGGGVLGAMNSKLFEIREQTGLFYTIGGSLISDAVHPTQPGRVSIQTIVSLDRLQEAQEAITHVIETVIDSLTEEDLRKAKNALINTLASLFESNASIANTFLAINRYNFPPNFYDTRAENLEKITLAQVQEAARKYLNKNRLITLRIGRVGEHAA